MRHLALALLLPIAAIAQDFGHPPAVLPAVATKALSASLDKAKPHAKSVWRDTPPINPDKTVNGYIEIAKGDRRKWEFNIATNERFIDRMMPESIGGYPINYGIVPQTISYDGDPFDVLVLGPPIAGGELVKGVIVGVMYMEDEKGLDSKVVLSRIDQRGRPIDQLTPKIQQEVGDFFKRYKQHQADVGAFSKIPGWGTPAEGLAYVTMTHRFYQECRQPAGAECAVRRPVRR